MGGRGLGEPLAYVVRPGRLGSAKKVSLVLRDGEMDARRLERLATDWRDYEASATPTSESLRTATEKSAATLRGVMPALVGETWRWPEV